MHATGATALRVMLTTAEDGTLTLHAADPAGQPVAAVSALTSAAPAARECSREC